MPKYLEFFRIPISDDTKMFLKSESYIDSALNIIYRFENVSSLKLNRKKKSVVLPIGGF